MKKAYVAKTSCSQLLLIESATHVQYVLYYMLKISLLVVISFCDVANTYVIVKLHKAVVIGTSD